MALQFQPEVPVFVGILLVTASLLVYSLRGYHRRGETPELQAFIVLLFVICVWQLTAIFIIGSGNTCAAQRYVHNYGTFGCHPSFNVGIHFRVHYDATAKYITVRGDFTQLELSAFRGRENGWSHHSFGSATFFDL